MFKECEEQELNEADSKENLDRKQQIRQAEEKKKEMEKPEQDKKQKGHLEDRGLPQRGFFYSRAPTPALLLLIEPKSPPLLPMDSS